MKYFEIILACALAIYTVLEGKKWKTIGGKKRFVILVGIIFSITVAYNAFVEIQKSNLLEKVNARIGDIQDIQNDETVFFPKLQIGNNGTAFILGKNVLQFNPVKNPLLLYVKNNRLIFTAIIYDEKGNAIAVIDNNIWKLYDNKFEYNNDDNSLELVRYGDRKVFFQIDLRKGIAHFSGYIFDKDRNGFYFAEDTTIRHGAIMSLIGPGYTSQSAQEYAPIIPLFKYPRERFLGVRN
jgi:hypothetical protein